MRSSTAASLISSSRAIAAWAKLSYETSASAGPRHSARASRSRPEASAGLPVREAAPRLLDQPLETVEVELIRPETNRVAGRPGDERIRRQRLAEARHVDAQGSRGVTGRVYSPELVDQALAGNDLVRMEEEGGEEGALLRSADLKLAARIPNLDRSEDPKLHLTASRPGTVPPVTRLKRA